MGAGKNAALASMLSDLEVQRARQRNADITNASNLSAQRGNEMGQMDANMAQTWIQNLAPWNAANYSGLASLFAAQGGGMGGMGGNMIGGGPGSAFKNQNVGSNWFGQYPRGGGMSPGQVGISAPSYQSQGFGGAGFSQSAPQQPSWWGAGLSNMEAAGKPDPLTYNVPWLARIMGC